jgi:hypothetical protein
LPPARPEPIIAPIIANWQYGTVKALNARDFLFRRSAGRRRQRGFGAGLGFRAHAADAGIEKYCLRAATAAASTARGRRAANAATFFAKSSTAKRASAAKGRCARCRSASISISARRAHRAAGRSA